MIFEPNENPNLIIYGHKYCLQAQLLVNALTKQQISYEWRDVIEGPVNFQEELKALANGNLSVPTVMFPDGSVLVEPWPGQVLEKLGLKQMSWGERLLQLWRGNK
jgi:mycoredoxin